MSKFIFFIMLFCGIFSNAQNEFITVWKPSNPSTTNVTGGIPSTNSQIWFPGTGSNFNLLWEEVGYPNHNGSMNNITSLNQFLVDFGTPFNPNINDATYKVKISNGSGIFNRVKFDLESTSLIFGDREKIVTITQWGNIMWTNMDGAFTNCNNLDVTATDIPNLTNVTSFEKIFSGCTSLIMNSTINNWDISAVTDLQFAFGNCIKFDQPVGNWDTSNVTNMAGTFAIAFKFNQPIGNWDTSNVLYFDAMFLSTMFFNQPIGNWDTSSATGMDVMFSNAKAFNQPIGNWNTSNVDDFTSMFFNASAFNQPIGLWNTSSGTLFRNMFQNATAFNQDIGLWNTSNALDMSYMFSNASSFNQQIPNWNTSNVTTMASMFQNTPLFNSYIGSWNTGSLVQMQDMFNNATAFNQNISGWNTLNVQNMTSTFNGASVYNQNLGSWNIPALSQAQNIFLNSAIDCQNYDNILYSWGNRANTAYNVNISSASPLIYSNEAAVAARNRLINSKGWTINGDTYDQTCVSSILSISETKDFQDLYIFPNPTSDFLIIKTKLEIEEAIILDFSGRIILNIKNPANKIDVSNLSTGNYILRLISDEDVKSFKFIKR